MTPDSPRPVSPRCLKPAVLACLGLLSFAGCLALLWLEFRTGQVNHRNYERIRHGMRLGEVEALLGGPGEEVEEQYLPRSPGFKPAVRGDRFFLWKGNVNGREIIIGLKDDGVCDKWFWEYSL